MKNYYDELEVSKTASKEVIEKVYKVLAKKYHPDITTETNKQAAEEKFKIISEAYEVLSDDEKRKEYDLELEQSNPYISYEQYINIVKQRDSLENELHQFRNSYTSNNQYYNGDSQTQYNWQNNNFNASYNSYQNANQTSSQNQSSHNTNSGKKTYYYTATGKPASAFDYYKYKIKNFISNVGFFLLLILAIVIVISNIASNGFGSLFF